MASGLSSGNHLIPWIILAAMILVGSASGSSPESVTSLTGVEPSWLLTFNISYTTTTGGGIPVHCGRYYATEVLSTLVNEGESGMQKWCDSRSRDSEHYVKVEFTGSSKVVITHNVIHISPVLNISQSGSASGKEQILQCGRSLKTTLVSTSNGYGQLWNSSLDPIPEDTSEGCISVDVTSQPIVFNSSDWQCPPDMHINVNRWRCEGAASRPLLEGDQTVDLNIVAKRSSTSFEIYWKVTSSAEYIDGFYLKYRVFPDPKEGREEDQSSTYNVVTIAGNVWSYTLRNLHKFTTYDLIMQPFNATHVGLESSIFRTQTSEDVPSSAPRNITAYFMDDTTLRVTWLPLPVGQVNGYLKGYKLFLSLDDVGVIGEFQAKPSEHALIVRDLLRGKPYKLQMVAFTSVGDGKKSSIITLDDDSSGNTSNKLSCSLLSVAFAAASVLLPFH